jgi:hypothetical protein
VKVKSVSSWLGLLRNYITGTVTYQNIDHQKVTLLINKATEGQRPLGIPKRRWEDNIKVDVQEVGGGGGD